MKRSLPLFALLVLAAGCRGGGTDPWLDPPPWDEVDPSERGRVEARSIEQVLTETPELVQTGGALACPNDGALPFVTEADAFQDAAAVDKARDGKASNHYLHDGIFHPDEDEQVVRVVGAYNRNNVLNPPTLPEGEWISLWAYEEVDGAASWIPLGRGQTGADGGVDFVFAGESRLPLGRWRVWGVIEGDGSCAEGGLFVYPKGTRFIVTDIDGTLTTSDDEFLTQIINNDYWPKQHNGATAMHRTWAAKGYEQIYVTARPFAGRLLTREWLRGDEFPFGYVETADSFVFGDPAAQYKAGFAREILAKGFFIDYAYGNAESDFDAYIDAGIPLDVQFSLLEAGEIAYRGTTPIADDDYEPHTANYVEARPDAAQPADLPARAPWDPGSPDYAP